MRRYTFPVKAVIWVLMLGAVAAVGYGIWRWRERWLERQRAAEARVASFLAQARPAAPPGEAPKAAGVVSSLPQQKLLFEAAAKAAEAGEPALSIQLYARLLSRFPDTAFASPARAAVELQKKKLVKA
jgi:hypothetical protein